MYYCKSFPILPRAESNITFHLIKNYIYVVTKYLPPYIAGLHSDNNSLIPYFCYVSFQNFFRLFPGFCFADGLASLALLRQGMKDKSSDGVFDWNVTGASLCYLGLEVRFLSQSCMKLLYHMLYDFLLYACLQFYILINFLITCIVHEKKWVCVVW